MKYWLPVTTLGNPHHGQSARCESRIPPNTVAAPALPPPTTEAFKETPNRKCQSVGDVPDGYPTLCTAVGSVSLSQMAKSHRGGKHRNLCEEKCDPVGRL